jgi:hypothetical protein
MNDWTSRQRIEHFWQTMNANDWHAVGALLHDDHLLVYPQSGERFRGRENFIALNFQYPAAGAWRFTVHRLIAAETEAVTDAGVTDSVRAHRVIPYFEFRDGLIWRMTEYWPDPFAAAPRRAHLVEHDQ